MAYDYLPYGTQIVEVTRFNDIREVKNGQLVPKVHPGSYQDTSPKGEQFMGVFNVAVQDSKTDAGPNFRWGGGLRSGSKLALTAAAKTFTGRTDRYGKMVLGDVFQSDGR